MTIVCNLISFNLFLEAIPEKNNNTSICMYYMNSHDRVYHIHDIIKVAYILSVLHFKHK